MVTYRNRIKECYDGMSKHGKQLADLKLKQVGNDIRHKFYI